MKIFSLVLCFICFSALADPPEIVYRAAMESPEYIKADGGMLPRGMDGTRPNQPPPNINLWDHTRGAETGMSRHDSGYVGTTTSRGFAISWVNDRLNHNGYVYHIRATPNFIDVNGTLRNYSPHAEELELAALGVIHWNQIIGWERVRGGEVGPFVRNPDYRGVIYSNLVSAGAQPQLAGFPAGHPAWTSQPWLAFANCELRSSCFPKESSQQFGVEWFKKFRKMVVARAIIMFQ